MHRVYIDKAGIRHLETFHPWLGARLVARSDPALASGDLARICEIKSDRALAWGFYADAPEGIAVRVAGWGEPPENVDASALIRERLLAAAALRDLLGLPGAGTDCYRLVHAEADGLGGLIIDRFGPAAAVQPNTPAMERHLDTIVSALTKDLGLAAVIVNRRDAARAREGLALAEPSATHGKASDPMRVRENGILYEISLLSGQKTGHYCDQRDNRRRFAELAASIARVRDKPPELLDVFCYTGAFSLNALKACGEARAVAIDESRPALDGLARNAALNNIAAPEPMHGDALGSMRALRKAGRRFDLINLDPPKLIGAGPRSRTGLDLYAALNETALTMLTPGGVLMTHSCSGRLSHEDFAAMLAKAARAAGRTIRLIGEGGQGPDHPVSLTLPSSRYLKTIVVEAE